MKAVISYGPTGDRGWAECRDDALRAIRPFILEEESDDDAVWERGNTLVFNSYGTSRTAESLLDRLVAMSRRRFLQVLLTLDEYGVLVVAEIVDGTIEYRREHPV